MDIKRHSISSIDQALKLWEDYHFLTKMQILHLTQGLLDLGSLGPTAHGDDFRRFLLEAREEVEFDSIRFGLQPGSVERLTKTNQQAATFMVNQVLQAQCLYEWSRHSRRVFHLNDDLVFLLRHTSVHDMTWGEVRWPFEAFALTFDSPIRCGEWEIDCCVLHPTGIPNNTDRWITGFDRRVRNWGGVTREHRKMYLRTVGKKDWKRLNNSVSKDLKDIQSQYLHALHLPVGSGAEKIVAAGTKFIEHERRMGFKVNPPEYYEPLYRVMAGLSQYLHSLPSGSPQVERSDRVVRTHDIDPRSIIAEAEVATVSSFYKLTSEERKAMENELDGPSGRSMSAHWRRGHWRKPMGMGHIPDAAKTVWVRPTLVRVDRLADGTLPGGTMMTFETPEPTD